jgi:hypothetical protein
MDRFFRPGLAGPDGQTRELRIKAGKIQEVQAVMMNLPDAEPTGWDTRCYGPGRGGWSRMPTDP